MYLITPDLAHRIARVGAMTYLEKPLWQIAKRSRPCSAWSFRSAPAASQPDDRWPEKKRSKNFSSPEQKKRFSTDSEKNSVRSVPSEILAENEKRRIFVFSSNERRAFKFGRNSLKFGRNSFKIDQNSFNLVEIHRILVKNLVLFEVQSLLLL